MPQRHPPPTYEEDQAADPYVYDDGDAPAYDDDNYVRQDPNPGLAEDEQQETDEDLARMHQREVDAEVAEDAEAWEGDIDDPEAGGEGWFEENPDEEAVRRELVERESGFAREGLDDTYALEGEEEN